MTFYATIDADSIRSYMPVVPVMLPASSWARYNLRTPRLPDHITDRAADCGGFVATRVWGDYRYTPTQYVQWLSTWRPQWAATMDYCCEDELTSGKPGIVRERQDKTTAMAWHFFKTYPGTRWAWVPTIQGWEVADYRRHARDLARLIAEQQRVYGTASPWRVGIGTLCQRAKPAFIHQVVQAVLAELPGLQLHLWGVKLTLLSYRPLPANVISIDSAAWNGRFGTAIEAQRRSGLSQRRYAYTVALPRYLARVQAALTCGRTNR